MTKQVDAEILTESDFTIRVDNLPEDCTDRMELKCFFEGCAGAVNDVVMYVTCAFRIRFSAKMNISQIETSHRECTFQLSIRIVRFTCISAFNDGELLLLYTQRGGLKKKIEAARLRGDDDVAEKLEQEVFKLDDEIKKVRSGLTLRPVCAFVTFEWQVCSNDSRWFGIRT